MHDGLPDKSERLVHLAGLNLITDDACVHGILPAVKRLSWTVRRSADERIIRAAFCRLSTLRSDVV